MQAPQLAKNDFDAAQTDTARAVAQKRVLAENPPEAVAQRKLAEMMNNGSRVLQQRALSDAIHNSPRMVAQRYEMSALFGRSVIPQGDGAMPAEASLAQREEKTNNTGLPNQLKSGIESLSGMSMDHVTVHYNSDKPAQLQAHAYAQGSEIHLGAGQERHLPHEAWHDVQQAQGRVRPTLQMEAGAVNDDASLEKEADMMGEKAAQFKGDHGARDLVAEERVAGAVTQRVSGFQRRAQADAVVQRVVYPNDNAMWAAVAPPFQYANIMAVIAANGELNTLYQDVIAHLGIMNFAVQANRQPEAAMTPNGILYDIYYDIPANQSDRFTEEAFFVGAIIHEKAHVATSLLYATNVQPGQQNFEPLHIANMHLPAPQVPLLNGTLVGDNQVNGPGGANAQAINMITNWDTLETILHNSPDFSSREQSLLQGRIDYARFMAPDAHYDTVLADVLFYLQHQRMHETLFYSQATVMLQEANVRRAAGVGAVPLVPALAAPAVDTDTLYQQVGLLINDPGWANQGHALTGHKTPNGIRQLRALLRNGGNRRELLVALCDQAAVAAAKDSRFRSAVTQQAYDALRMDFRARGLAPTIAAVNAVIALV